ncbi:carbohydrate sulfotransferase 5-like [Dendropsophus ebraccatus]|uniref:carbohydrate sulfotransferase 5-like n=1 Tax=Dendropsophus ebraccatus TaxID=150705 RepID=UPI00383129BA
MARRTATYYIIAIIIIFQAINMCVLYLGAKFNTASSNHSQEKVHLLILSTWRSGSSLVGQCFSQHPDVFYLKEPSWHVWRTMFQNYVHVLHMSVRDLIRSIFRCDMFVFDVYMPSKTVSDLFHWASSRALCSPPSCSSFSRTEIVDETVCKKACGQSPFQKVEDTCNTYSHIVVQEYRIFDLTVLYSLLKDPSINLKILHVVRDPRAIAKSRRDVRLALNFDNKMILKGEKSQKDDLNVLRKICKSQAEIYTAASSLELPFLQGRYMLLRYEDLVRNPLKKIKEIYSFAYLELPKNLKPWIYKMTRGPSLKKMKPFNITPRNALKVSQAWRKGLSFEMVKKVQAVCRDAIDIFRYKLVDSTKELRDLTIDTMLPRLREDFIWLSENKKE